MNTILNFTNGVNAVIPEPLISSIAQRIAENRDFDILPGNTIKEATGEDSSAEYDCWIAVTNADLLVGYTEVCWDKNGGDMFKQVVTAELVHVPDEFDDLQCDMSAIGISIHEAWPYLHDSAYMEDCDIVDGVYDPSFVCGPYSEWGFTDKCPGPGSYEDGATTYYCSPQTYRDEAGTVNPFVCMSGDLIGKFGLVQGRDRLVTESKYYYYQDDGMPYHKKYTMQETDPFLWSNNLVSEFYDVGLSRGFPYNFLPESATKSVVYTCEGIRIACAKFVSGGAAGFFQQTGNTIM